MRVSDTASWAEWELQKTSALGALDAFLFADLFGEFFALAGVVVVGWDDAFVAAFAEGAVVDGVALGAGVGVSGSCSTA